MAVIVRFAPSPTGLLHIGGARTALFNYLFVKKQSGPPNGETGKFILRIDDTDKERSKPEFEKDILDSLAWLGLKHDEIYYQSQRSEIYKTQLEKLISDGKAYLGEESETSTGQVVRFKNPNTTIEFDDLIKGKIGFDTRELGDFVLARNINEPVYHFASVVDDALMGVTHVIRGEDHISNTPRQILMLEALGVARPQYGHIPLILATDRSKLSKRHGAVAVSYYRGLGYLPDALLNFIATLGWSPQAAKLEQEVLSLEELIKYFDLGQVQTSGAIFNLEKLNWFNRQYLQRLTFEDLWTQLQPTLPATQTDRGIWEKIWPEVVTRVSTFGELAQLIASGELAYFFVAPQPNSTLLRSTAHLPTLIEILKAVPESNFTKEGIKTAVWDYATERGRGEVLWPFRIALTGREKSADPFTVAELLGQVETLKRLRWASDH